MVPLLADVMRAERLQRTLIIARMCGKRVAMRASSGGGIHPVAGRSNGMKESGSSWW